MASSRRLISTRRAQAGLAQEMRAAGCTWPQVARAFREQYRVGALASMRLARGWSQRELANRWNARWPDAPKTFKSISYWENWPAPTGRKPDLVALDRLAQLYQCQLADLVAGYGDYRPDDTDADMLVHHPVAAAAFARAEELEREITARWPQAFAVMDQLRRNPPGRWPFWCLLPTSVAAMAMGWSTGGPAATAAVSALYAWRFARSVYVYDPAAANQVMSSPPDDLTGVDPLGLLPQWCVYVAGGNPHWPGNGLWAHLDYDYTDGCPTLRLLVDLAAGGLDGLVPIRFRLDRPLADGVADVRGLLDQHAAHLTDVLDRLVALVIHPGHARANIRPFNQDSGTRPQRDLRRPGNRTTWLIEPLAACEIRSTSKLSRVAHTGGAATVSVEPAV